jgi:hypothetical protein
LKIAFQYTYVSAERTYIYKLITGGKRKRLKLEDSNSSCEGKVENISEPEF